LSNDFAKVTVASDFLKVFDFVAPLVKHYVMPLAEGDKVSVRCLQPHAPNAIPRFKQMMGLYSTQAIAVDLQATIKLMHP
jgi:hypothetical protein